MVRYSEGHSLTTGSVLRQLMVSCISTHRRAAEAAKPELVQPFNSRSQAYGLAFHARVLPSCQAGLRPRQFGLSAASA